MNIDPALILTALSTAGAGKVFIEVCDSMPPLPPTAGYFARWIYAFMQRLASNGAKAEAARNPAKAAQVA